MKEISKSLLLCMASSVIGKKVVFFDDGKRIESLVNSIYLDSGTVFLALADELYNEVSAHRIEAIKAH